MKIVSEEILLELRVKLDVILNAEHAIFLARNNTVFGPNGHIYCVNDIIIENVLYFDEFEIDPLGHFIIGSNGGGEAFLTNKNGTNTEVFSCPFADYETDSFIKIAKTFDEFYAKVLADKELLLV